MSEREESSEERLAIGQSIIERIRRETNHEYGYFSGDEGEDVFVSLYLTERDSCLPAHLTADDLLLDIRAMFCQVFDGLRDELKSRLGIADPLWLAVDPSYEDTSFSVLCSDQQVLMLHWTKAWNFFWPDEQAMAADLGSIYEEAAQRLVPALERRDGPGV